MSSPNRKTVVVLGKGSLAIAIADWFRRSTGYELCCVVPSIPEPGWTPSLIEWSKRQGVSLVDSGQYQDIPGLDAPDAKIDLVLSVYYGEIIAPWFLDSVGRTLNLHNSPLPKYRGCNPINWALKNGETMHGVTIHDMIEKVDAGPIVSQVEFTIDPQADEVIDVYNRALAFGYTLFTQTIPLLDQIQTRAQDGSVASYYRRADAPKLAERRGFTRTQSSCDADAPKTVTATWEEVIAGAPVPSARADTVVHCASFEKRETKCP